MSSREEFKYSGPLKAHWNWNTYLSIALIGLTIGLFFINRRAGTAALIFSACYYTAVIIIYFYYKPRLLRSFIQSAERYGEIRNEAFRQVDIASVIVDSDGKLLWRNDCAAVLMDKTPNFHGDIADVFPQLIPSVFPTDDDPKDIDVPLKDMLLRAHIRRISLNELVDRSSLIERSRKNETVWAFVIFFTDETELSKLRQENYEQKGVVALCYIDNYEEALEDLDDDVHSSLLNVLVDREINKYFTSYDCLSRKLEKDKYLVLMNRKSLDEVEKDRFSVLEEVKTVHIGNGAVMTVSIGAGVGGDYNQNYDSARAAIEMALARGGDQAVVNRGGAMQFFGGKSQSGERHTRVKARVKAQALREILQTCDKVIAMGHKITDMDTLGAAIGIYRTAKTLNKRAWIVVDEDSLSVKNWLKILRGTRDYTDGVFINREKAMELCDANTALVVLDTNRPGNVECEELLQKTKAIVVMDHHRQSTDQIQGAALSYIEPSASSACEMVAEILEYFSEDVKLKNVEADCLYAGIIIDTNNFVAKSGSRTFEAAAYLRRCGADSTRVRKSLRDDLASYRARAEAIRRAEMFMGEYAIAILPNEGLEGANMIAAQAANELLNIIGVKASFVVTEYDDRAFISARAIDEVNVQLIMERLGGGGHLAIAGAQLSGITPQEAVEKIKDTLTAMTEAGDF